ncbi:transcription elongation factor GreA [Candidatus Uhrbacteria bacterium]|nr:transcription elongation factor GreA [Candidatus Uhrbacteria bacterium]
MQVPIRRAQKLKQYDDGSDANQITAVGLQKMKKELVQREAERPEAIEEVDRTRQFGDFSENAEYQDAKFRLRRINARIDTLKERIKRAVIIQHAGPSNNVELGSIVTVRVNDKTKTYEIVGPRESNPSRGRISHVSPLGSTLLHHAPGDQVTLKTENGETMYQILQIE